MAQSAPYSSLEDEIASSCCRIDLCVSGTIEWWITRKENVGNNSNGPQITALVVASVDNLWAHVVGGSYSVFHWSLTGIVSSREAKINELNCAVFSRVGKENIFRFDISMDPGVIVKVEYCLKDRLDNSCCLEFSEATCSGGTFGDLIEQFSSGVLIGDDVDMICIFEDIYHSHD